MRAEQLVDKLEGYEKQAYESGMGLDWLAEIGEKFKFYIMDSVENNQEPTIEGFMEWINKLASRLLNN